MQNRIGVIALSMVVCSCSSGGSGLAVDPMPDAQDSAVITDSGDVSPIDAARDSGTSNCPGKSREACAVEGAGCAWVTGTRIDPTLGCFVPSSEISFCIKFWIAPAIVSCRIRLSTGEMFEFADAKAPPDADYRDWRECTFAEEELIAEPGGYCPTPDGGTDGG